MMIRTYAFCLLLLLFFVHRAENTDVLGGLTEQLSKYSIVNPQVIQRKGRSINTSELKENYDDQISYSLNINDRKHILHLQKNRDFLHPRFLQGSSDSTRNSSYSWKHMQCHYHGEVEGYEKSLVAVSTCSGLRGVIVLGNETYALEPVPRSASNDHLLYLLKDLQTEPVACGVVNEDTTTHEPFEPGQSLTSLLRERRSLPQTSYVELVLVVDNQRYVFKNRNETAVVDEMVTMANLLDGYYKPLNIRIVLIGVEIFKDSNPFSVEGSAGEVLRRFVNWRKSTLIPAKRHDIGQLIVGRPSSYSGVLGMAYVGSVCSVASSGGINVFGNDNLAYASTVVAHEMGHNLGMNHDLATCECDGRSCIMSATAGGATTFSSCSEDNFVSLILRGKGTCLRNPPSPSDVIDKAECGNGRLDEGEQCDCGKPEECQNKCCDPNTCTFASSLANCADGACCDNCRIVVSGTPCRNSANTCDLPEYCDGSSAFCPEDYYKMDGLPCENAAAYCYEGRCQTYDDQCKQLFTPDPATKADDICFSHANTLGNLFGNCGVTSSGAFIKCAVEDAMCGKVQCTNVDVNNPPPGAQVTIQIIQGKTCVNADFHLGTDVLDPAYVKPGSPCGEGKACLDFHCVNASALLSNTDCTADKTCNGRGECNDQGNCHCNNGWAPPFCVTAGRGGSINSGPAMIDYSLRNGLLIFFLLVVPVVTLVVVGLLYVYRRQSFDPCIKRGVKPHNTQNRNANQQSNARVQTPAPGPDNRRENPSTIPPPQSDFRYGEMDYWSAAENDPTPKPTSHVQGPGAPRPIPPKVPPI
ncbi:disintegrin and metalloproteinase domain-containing protein 9 isoform X2 [Salarias fasciatus]|uniref:Disintegrin and metalloproteinase domain-containing protein 9-like n=1 Tax=Salarias fasciatus TaxID=181472 RepID=A0A672J8Z0_SALFA|nr:disintegrin and metalloproteinase domain-containing protein 9-like isoform X2 [Salarias fasciatus]